MVLTEGTWVFMRDMSQEELQLFILKFCLSLSDDPC